MDSNHLDWDRHLPEHKTLISQLEYKDADNNAQYGYWSEFARFFKPGIEQFFMGSACPNRFNSSKFKPISIWFQPIHIWFDYSGHFMGELMFYQ